jgi:Gpi18-like mannosyltransferase
MVWLTAFILRCSLYEEIEADGFEFVNPMYLYEGGNLNWFGAIFIALIWNLLFAPFALIYWMYKLCTAGRNK